MGRRTRMRMIKNPPDNQYFHRMIEKRPSENQVVINMAEFEALRLKHYIKLNQKDSAEKMGVSQPTFSRILEGAHQKVTQALMEGKFITVYGGNVDVKKGFIGYGCLNCNEEWEDKTASRESKTICPKCNSEKTYYLVREPL
ncbi:MAG: DUF134 domain-containing protein [Candidatus Heimdallarchaeota archaeon]